MFLRWPGLGVGLGSAGVALALLYAGRVAAGGWAFPLDDAYIHMAVARNVAESGTWGVNPGEFASASSSPAWTVLLAGAFAVFGPREWIPVMANLAALVALFLVLDGWFADAGARVGARIAGLVAVSVAAVLPVVAALGMEHVLHALLALVLARRVERFGAIGPLAVLGALLPMVRYEALFAIAVAMLVLGARGRRGEAVVLGASAGLAVTAFGVWTLSNGAGFLPNSLHMKGSLGTGFLTNFGANLREGSAAFVLTALVAALAPFAGRLRGAGLFFVGTATLHLTLASVGWYYRYEAWLLAWGTAWLVLVAVSGVMSGWARGLLVVGTLAFAWLAGSRAFDAVRYFEGRCVYIRDVKVAVGRALMDVAPGSVVALHDIGAVAFYGGAGIVDLAGLGTDEVAALGASHRFTGPTIAELVARRGAVVAVATRSWMEADRPPGWEPVGQLEWGLDAERRIEPIVVYALRPEGEAFARAWLDEAASRTSGRASYGPVGSGSR